MTLREKLRKIRQKAHIPQEKLGEILGYSQDWINKVENKNGTISASYVQKWCEACGYPYQKFKDEYAEDIRLLMAAEIKNYAKSLKNLDYEGFTLEQLERSYDSMNDILRIGDEYDRYLDVIKKYTGRKE